MKNIARFATSWTALGKQISTQASNTVYWIDSIGKWFFADVAYTLLPIFVIWAIKVFTTGKTDFLYLSPEWSFATIVSFGIAITNLIELKTEYQRDFSHRVYSATRILILFLILSALILALVVLREGGYPVKESILSRSQMVFFALSILFLFVIHMVKEDIVKSKSVVTAHDLCPSKCHTALKKRNNDNGKSSAIVVSC